MAIEAKTVVAGARSRFECAVPIEMPRHAMQHCLNLAHMTRSHCRVLLLQLQPNRQPGNRQWQGGGHAAEAERGIAAIPRALQVAGQRTLGQDCEVLWRASTCRRALYGIGNPDSGWGWGWGWSHPGRWFDCHAVCAQSIKYTNVA